ncbi:MAG TPA: efflux RND transporter permease subunit, partial [Burkholderiaceae bacterium]
LDWALDARWQVMLVLAGVVALNVWLFVAVPKGFFPQEDTGQLNCGLRADQSISFDEMQAKLRQVVGILHDDPAVDTVVGFTGGARAGGGFVFVNLKPRGQRKEGSQAVIARLRPKLAKVTGLQLFLNPRQDVRMGGRQTNSTYQYTLKADNKADLATWAGKLAEALKTEPALTDVDTDQQENGVESFVHIDGELAARHGITNRAIDNALYDAFGQRQVATIYDALNQYHVIMETMPQFGRTPQALADVRVPGSGTGTAFTASPAASTAFHAASAAVAANPGARDSSTGATINLAAATMVPLSQVASFGEDSARASISHQDGELATTISYNLAAGASLSDAQEAIERQVAAIHMPINVRGSMQGTAAAAQQNDRQQPLLILAAIVVIYIVLGVLYESLVHPVTVLSTLPSAGVGAVLALMLFGMEFSLIALIAVFLLIGIVKKNAILVIDFALEAERSRGLAAQDAVREACLQRFRPILMTTLAAALGALPLAIGFGEGSELRRPLGIAIIGGLVASQLLTLLTTPVVYLLLDKLRSPGDDERSLARHANEDPHAGLPPPGVAPAAHAAPGAR